jgi:hypothetical protein
METKCVVGYFCATGHYSECKHSKIQSSILGPYCIYENVDTSECGNKEAQKEARTKLLREVPPCK